MPWIAQFFTDQGDSDDGDPITGEGLDEDGDPIGYEYSVVHSDNKHGQRSWGWGDTDKIIVFSDAQTDDHEKARKVVIAIKDMMNKEGF